MPHAQEYVELPSEGRRYEMVRTARLGDVGPHGRVRLDAVARFLQDIAGADGDDAGVGGVWVLRRTALRFSGAWPRLGAQLQLVTFCSGSGSRWAERRTIATFAGGRIDSAAVWVLIDQASGRPMSLPARFAEVYGSAASGRVVSSRLTVPAPDGESSMRPWPLRATDFDVLGHVNNARYWEAVEDALAAWDCPRIVHAVLEFRVAIEPGGTPELVFHGNGSTRRVWLRGDAGVHAACELTLAEG